MRLLAIDYGLKRVGLAISEGFLADPLKVVKNSENLTLEIAELCEQHQIEKIVIGIPGRSKMAQVIKNFGKKLASQTRQTVVYWDETLTSVEAEKIARKRTEADAVAAAIILQSYIDANEQG